jgi:hypothetical protein
MVAVVAIHPVSQQVAVAVAVLAVRDKMEQ